MSLSRGMAVGDRVVTAVFCLQMGFNACAQPRLPQVAEMVTHLGFPGPARMS